VAARDKKIIVAAVRFVKAYRRRQIEGVKDPLQVNELKQRAKDIIKAVDEKYDPKNADGLIPPDLERCQAEIKEGSFMTFGPRSNKRCKEKPTVIAEENKPGSDGKKGRMSLCAKCTVIFLDKMGVGFATITPIKEEKEGEDG